MSLGPVTSSPQTQRTGAIDGDTAAETPATPNATPDTTADAAKTPVGSDVVSGARAAFQSSGEALRKLLEGGDQVASGKPTRPCGPRGGKCTASRGLTPTDTQDA